MKIIALILIAVAALALGFVEAFATGPLPEDRVFTHDERRAMAEMREATKADPNFAGDPGFYLADSGHSSAGAGCYDERWMHFYYLYPSPPLIGGVLTTPMRHRTVSATAPAVCVALTGVVTLREDLYRATSYFDPRSCVRVDGPTITPTPETCGFTAWVPVAEEPPVPVPGPPCLQTPLGCFPLLPPNGQIEDPWAL